MLQGIGPRPLVEPEKLNAEADWIEAGRKVFRESVVFRTRDSKLIGLAQSKEFFEGAGVEPLPDGTVTTLRWLPTKRGVALGFTNCSACHLLYLADGTPVPGASSFAMTNNSRNGLGPLVRSAEHVLPGEPPFQMGSGPFGAWLFQAFGVPWPKDPSTEPLKT